MRRARPDSRPSAAAIAVVTLLALGAFALSSGGASAQAPHPFVDTFAKTCVPQRLTYEGTVAQAKTEGWVETAPDAHPEFAAVMAKSAAGLKEAEADGLTMGFQSTNFMREQGGTKLFLVVSFTTSEYLNEIGCYLYDFDATEPVPSIAVTNMLGVKPANAQLDEAITAYVWGPPPKMPRTLDTYMTFLPPGSPHVEAAGFDGVVLKFTTSAPDKEG
jgi:hypothetical protein